MSPEASTCLVRLFHSLSATPADRTYGELASTKTISPLAPVARVRGQPAPVVHPGPAGRTRGRSCL